MKYKQFYGEFGGRYVAEVLRPSLDTLEKEYLTIIDNKEFWREYNELSEDFTGRPTPFLFAENSTKIIGGAKIYIKLEGLANTGAHKINNALGQVMLAKRMGKKRIIAETGAGQHGVATAAACAKMDLPCTIYMGEVDIKRQRPNLFLMELYGAEIIPVSFGSRTLKDAVNAALMDWAGSFEDTHYLIGSALGPSPYPAIVKTFQSVIGKEVESKINKMKIDVEAMIACVGGGSNAIGFFSPFLEKEDPRLIAVEAGGTGTGPGEHASRMSGQGQSGIIQGYKSLFLTNKDGQVLPTHSISAGLDYPGIGPELAYYGKTNRIEYTSVTDTEAVKALKFFAKNEGILFALESAHAGAKAMQLAADMPKDKAVIINMSGRGDKDIFITAKLLSPDTWMDFMRNEVSEYEE
jgi:tryptophan synthase beta chain